MCSSRCGQRGQRVACRCVVLVCWACNDFSPADASNFCCRQLLAVNTTTTAVNNQQVSAYHLTDFSPSPSATNSNGLGWASHMGVAKPAGSAGRSLLCFSRPVDAPQAAVSKQLDPSGGCDVYGVWCCIELRGSGVTHAALLLAASWARIHTYDDR